MGGRLPALARSERLARARELPGFRDEPDCFLIDRYALDEDRWTEGFVTVPLNE